MKKFFIGAIFFAVSTSLFAIDTRLHKKHAHLRMERILKNYDDFQIKHGYKNHAGLKMKQGSHIRQKTLSKLVEQCAVNSRKGKHSPVLFNCLVRLCRERNRPDLFSDLVEGEWEYNKGKRKHARPVSAKRQIQFP
jgi:hypothetical protein